MTTTKTRQRPAAVLLTPAAEARVTTLMASAPADAIGVMLSTPRRGCSGLAYSVDYVTEAVPFDERIETPGSTFFIDGGSVLYLIGSTMDWQEDDFTAGFVFANPTAKGSCGCGESFTVYGPGLNPVRRPIDETAFAPACCLAGRGLSGGRCWLRRARGTGAQGHPAD